MGRDFLPETDHGAADWMKRFAGGIAQDPFRYMLSEPDAEHLSRTVSAYVQALAVSSDPAARTKGTVQIKDEKRNIARELCRHFAALIKCNAGVSDTDKIAIGVPPINKTRTPRDVPGSVPSVAVIAATPGAHVVTFRDSLGLSGKALPFGAIHMQLGVIIGDAKVFDPKGVEVVKCCTRSPVNVEHAQAHIGKMATYFGRWVSQRGEMGGWSAPSSLCIV